MEKLILSTVAESDQGTKEALSAALSLGHETAHKERGRGGVEPITVMLLEGFWRN